MLLGTLASRFSFSWPSLVPDWGLSLRWFQWIRLQSLPHRSHRLHRRPLRSFLGRLQFNKTFEFAGTSPVFNFDDLGSDHLL